MDFDQAYARLRNHANLPDAGAEELSSLGFALWRVGRGCESPQALPALFEDVLECLEIVNRQWNGDTPSTTPNAQKQLAIDRWLAYCISGLMARYLETTACRAIDGETRKLILDHANSLALAWDAILAGDIDSLQEHIKLEKWCGPDT